MAVHGPPADALTCSSAPDPDSVIADWRLWGRRYHCHPETRRVTGVVIGLWVPVQWH